MKHHLITLGFFVAAGACYMTGLETGFMILVAAGVILEGVTWMRLRRGAKAKAR